MTPALMFPVINPFYCFEFLDSPGKLACHWNGNADASMSRPKFFRDPVHLQIRFDAFDITLPTPDLSEDHQISFVLQKLIDTRAFQRLRGIRQNGLTNFVFHGAEHSRFSHSMGVSFLARVMFDRLTRNASITPSNGHRLQVAAASLLHDIGHGPFSHTLEEILREADIDFHHETMTKRFVEEHKDVAGTLASIDSELPMEVSSFFEKKKKEDHWRYRIVSSQMDADRLDYVHRDAMFAGVKGHGFDLERLLDLLSIHGVSLAVERGAIESVEAYLVTLDHLWRSIYYHHAVRAATKMLTVIFRRAVELYRNGDKAVFSSRTGRDHPILRVIEDGSKVPLEIYERMTDACVWELIEFWEDSKDPVLSDMSTRLFERRLLKTIDFELTDPQRFNDLQNRLREETLNALGANDDLLSYYLLMDDQDRTSYKRYNLKPESQADSIWLIGGNRQPAPIEEDGESRLVDALKSARRFDRFVVLPEVREALTTS